MPSYINGLEKSFKLRMDALQDAVEAVEGKTLRGTAAVTSSSIAANSRVTFTSTVTGAAVGDAAEAYPPADIGWSTAGGPYFAYVSAANTVTIKIRNDHASTAWSLPAGTWEVRVFKK